MSQGNSSSSAYVSDPINDSDYSGMFSLRGLVKSVVKKVKKVVKAAVRVVKAAAPALKATAVVVGVGAVVIFTLPEDVVAGAVAAVVGAGAEVTTAVTDSANEGATAATKFVPTPPPSVMERAASDAEEDANEFDAGTPVGSRAAPIQVTPRTNLSGSVAGRDYSGHAFDQMQGRGIYPSLVENTINTGSKTLQSNGNLLYYDPMNDVSVVTNQQGRVVTTFWGEH